MVSTRFLGVVSTSMLVVGALSIGQALHLTLVTGELGYTATPVVVYSVAGIVAIAIGYRARRPVAEQYALTSDARERGEHKRGRSPSDSPSRSPDHDEERGDATTGDGTEYDPAMSPLGDTAPGDTARERDRDDE